MVAEPLLDACMHWSAVAAGSLVTATWQGCALVMAVALGLGLLSRQRLLPAPGATGRSLIWSAVFLLVVLLHVAPFASWPHRATGAGAASILHVPPAWGMVVAAVWAMLSVYGAARLARSALRLRRVARRATLVPFPPACPHKLGVTRRRAALCTSLDIDRPSVLGFRSPRILLPAGLLAELSPDELEQIVLHELEHLRRADDWTNLVQKLVLVLFPLNPVLLWIEHRLCSERELACDDGVLRRTRARKAYARCLARLGEYSMVQRGVSLALGAWEKQSELSRRVYRILSQPETQPRRVAAKAVTCFFMLLLLAGAGPLLNSRPIVSFAAGTRILAAQAGSGSALPRPDPAIRPAHLRNVSLRMPEAGAMPGQVAPAVRRVHRPAPPHAPLRVARNRQGEGFGGRAPAAKQWLALANWQPAGRRASLPEPDDLLPAFAAVRTENGWLIIEL